MLAMSIDTGYPRWRVRDIVAHLVDTSLRRLSFQRDGASPPSPAGPLRTDRDLVAYVNELNAAWIRNADRLSPRVLTDLYARTGVDLADFVEGLRLDGPAHRCYEVLWRSKRLI